MRYLGILPKAMLAFFAETLRRAPSRCRRPMTDDDQLLGALWQFKVPFVIIGGHAVNFHGFVRATEDVDLVWLRSPESERALFEALKEIDAHYIGDEIDPATGIEKTHPVTFPFIQNTRLMMLLTRHGFLDLFDYVPGIPQMDINQLFATSVEIDSLRFVSLPLLREMKRASGRPKDLLDLENLAD